MTAVTPNWAIHSDPTAKQVAEQELLAAYRTLQLVLGQLPADILKALANAILSALGLEGVAGPLKSILAGVESGLTNNVVSPLEQLVYAFEHPNAAIHNLFDGTAVPLSGFTDQLDGTVSFVGNAIADMTAPVTNFAGSIPAFLDNLDGTARGFGGVSIVGDGTALFGPLLGVNPVVLAQDAHNGMQSLLNSAGVSDVRALASALAGVLPAALDNADGTATRVGSQVVHNLDGTATYLAQTVAGAGNALIDNLDGTAMSFFHAMSQGFNNALGGLLAAFAGSPVAGSTTTQAQQAQVSAAAAALQQRLAIIGNGAEEEVNILFSAYSNGSMPSTFTASGGTTLSQQSISGGDYVFTGVGTAWTYYNAAAFLGDYQRVDATFTATPVTGSWAGMMARMQPSPGYPAVQAQYTVSSGSWNLVSYNASAIPTTLATFSDTFSPNVQYSLVCGNPTTGDPYYFQILKAGSPLPSTGGLNFYEDIAHTSFYGGAYRSAGIAANSAPFSISQFGFEDTAQSQPSVLVTTSESTSSTTYTDLATTSDEVAVNIGSSGTALVNLVSQVNGTVSGANQWTAVQLSGSNIMAASDAYAVLVSAATGPMQVGSSFTLTGLSPGLTVFKMKYRTGAGTSTFSNRRISVIAL